MNNYLQTLNTVLLIYIVFGSTATSDMAKTLSGKTENDLRVRLCRKVIDLEYKASSYVADAKFDACKRTAVYIKAEEKAKKNKADINLEIDKLVRRIEADDTELIDSIMTVCKNIDFSRKGYYTDGFEILSSVIEVMECP